MTAGAFQYSELLFILSISSAWSQVVFTTLPKDQQLYGRDLTTNKGTVSIEGEVNFSGAPYSSIRVEVYREGQFLTSFEEPLNNALSEDNFSFDIEIEAELANYDFWIFGVDNGTSTLLEEVTRVVAGDVYIIEGQSNAEAQLRTDSSVSAQSDFIRVYASGIPVEASLLSNDNWYVGQGDGNRFSNGNAGQWGLKLAREIIDKYGIPVAIFNGAHGGKEIAFFQRPADYQVSQASNYGRLYYRLEQSGLKNHVRAVLWSQGEKDGLPGIGTSTKDYILAFLALRSAWYEDFPSIEKIYLFQTKNGCNTPIENIMGIKEAQRQLAFEFDDIRAMSTAALPNTYDNCHFNYVNGYEEFARRMFRLLDHDLYGETQVEDINAPMILSAQLVDDLTIKVKTDAINLSVTGQVQELFLRDANGAEITNIIPNGSHFLIELDRYPGTEATLSYYAPDGVMSGNFLVNDNNVEMLCFKDVPVKKSTAWLEENESPDAHVYPNPVKDVLHVNSLSEVEKLELLNTAGTAVKVNAGANTLNIADIPAGIYLLRVSSQSTISNHRVLVTH